MRETVTMASNTNLKRNIEWIIFDVYPNTSTKVRAKYSVTGENVVTVKLITQIPKGQYYSVLNDAQEQALTLFNHN